MTRHFKVQNSYDRPALAVDLDGVLAISDHEGGLRAPHEPMLQLVNRLRSRGWYVIVWSARPASHHPLVQAWLTRFGIEVDQIALGTKPAADLFIDDKGLLPPLDALEEHAEMVWNDYRLEAWTMGASQGPLSQEMAQVKENPEAAAPQADPNFMISLPVSAGVDSTTCWLMAREAGLPHQAAYVNTGAVYAQQEIDAVVRIGSMFGEQVDVIMQPTTYQRWDYIDRGRNAVIVWALAQRLQAAGLWGEVWLGDVSDWSEEPVRGGDKSRRWLSTMQHLLVINGMDVRLVSPLGTVQKVDAVRWCLAHGYDEVLAMTRSCYETAAVACGRCWCCFHRWLAFEACDVGSLAEWPHGYDFTEQAARTRRYVEQLSDRPEWSAGRLAYVWDVLNSGRALQYAGVA
jgi:7-cyano-7-deazaguanine synthase in queuosine biosynthesis